MKARLVTYTTEKLNKSEKSILSKRMYGYTDKSKKQAVSIDTIFGLGSTSKTITAVAFLIAQQQGLVKLADPISRYYPEFTVKSRFADDETNKITFRHLLSHRSGLAGFSRRGASPGGGDLDGAG